MDIFAKNKDIKYAHCSNCCDSSDGLTTCEHEVYNVEYDDEGRWAVSYELACLSCDSMFAVFD